MNFSTTLKSYFLIFRKKAMSHVELHIVTIDPGNAYMIMFTLKLSESLSMYFTTFTALNAYFCYFLSQCPDE